MWAADRGPRLEGRPCFTSGGFRQPGCLAAGGDPGLCVATLRWFYLFERRGPSSKRLESLSSLSSAAHSDRWRNGEASLPDRRARVQSRALRDQPRGFGEEGLLCLSSRGMGGKVMKSISRVLF